MTSKIVLAIGYACPSNSNLAQFAPDSVKVWHQGDTAFVGMTVVNDLTDLLDVSNLDKDAIKSQFDSYRKIVQSVAGEGKWKSLDDRHDWFELFTSGEPQIVALAV
jgi:hypothetical protein